MRLKESRPPRECERTVRSALHDFWGHTHLAKKIFGNARWEELALSAPHQVYSVGLEDVARGDTLSHADLTGWRYILLAGDQPLAAAEVSIIRQDGKEQYEFSNFDHGPFVENTVEGIRQVEPRLNRLVGNYEFRALNIPALHVFTLWFHDQQDILIPLPPTNAALKPYDIYTESEFTQSLHDVAIRQLDFDESFYLDYPPELSKYAGDIIWTDKDQSGRGNDTGQMETA